ncbi:serine/threonine protein phosphatase 1 [Pustulibacterium marinum]|uniref:Serine/threonine protein phosphatase 1 n=1 Tax=Pustulibacterium marinum TaxID=1224947 RepID=A0A1I7HIA7_9FLAO|nr:metallophosphoesterase family protein [Pustulibacterium marinum]SFU60435.1 serine/threonine protein phosphatase 1 [Pustulibacterium marinum]
MRTLVIGDIHGGYRALLQILERANVTEDDKLIFLGDYVDGWSESPKVIAKLIELRSTNECIFMQGNHDELLLDYFQSETKNDMWFMHGGGASVAAYEKLSKEELAIHIDFLSNLQHYYIDDEKRLFIHAGFTNLHGVDFEYFPKLYYWDRTLWELALAIDPSLEKDDIRYPKRLLHYKEIFIGHTPLTRIGESTPQNRANVWNVDTGAAYKNPLTIMDVDTKEYWQSDNVNDLYPEEKGRN